MQSPTNNLLPFNNWLKKSTFNNWLKKSIGIIGLAGISCLIDLPGLSQGYPPLYLFQPAANPDYPYRSNKRNLFDSLKKNTNFENFVAEIEAVQGLTQILEYEVFTLLAPSDEAFENLPDDIYDKFSQPGNRAAVLRYHLIPGIVTQEALDRGEITTIEGKTIIFSNQNGTSKLNNANAKIPSTLANNGVIIEIDKVLFPPNF